MYNDIGGYSFTCSRSEKPSERENVWRESPPSCHRAVLDVPVIRRITRNVCRAEHLSIDEARALSLSVWEKLLLARRK